MKIKYAILWFSLFFHAFVFTQAQEIAKVQTRRVFYNPSTQIGELPHEIRETSGLIWFNDLFWTHNDSGGKPEIYGLDFRNGKVKATVRIVNATNVDWEEIAQDEEYIYIGDFGNNRGVRKDLCIYKIPKSSVPTQGSADVLAEKISFQWEKQTEFPIIADRTTNFDCEAMFALHDRLILFTKNWSNQRSDIYSLPKTPGHYTAVFLLEWDAHGLITGADYEETSHTLALCGYKNFTPFVYLIQNFNTVDVAGWNALRLELDEKGGSQTEGICFGPLDHIYISTEETSIYPPRIFKIDYQPLLDKLPLKGEEVFEYHYSFVDEQLRLRVRCKTGDRYKVTLQNRKGQIIKQWKLKPNAEPQTLLAPIKDSRNLILKLDSGKYLSTIVLQNQEKNE